MGKRTIGFSAFILASAVLATLLFSGVVMGPPPAPAPPVDFNVNVQNTPLPVEVTNPSPRPVATEWISVYMVDYVAGTDLDSVHNNEHSSVDIGDKTVVFTGGSVTGHLVFSSANGEGSVPAAAFVTVWTHVGGMHMFAVPFDSPFRVERVDAIALLVYVYNPELPGSASYTFTAVASVFYFIED